MINKRERKNKMSGCTSDKQLNVNFSLQPAKHANTRFLDILKIQGCIITSGNHVWLK